ncbi:histidine kinase [Streptomyces kunmingensis]|uniref:histidine kinase n=1 Tax=Streptomyces kunmingensis TaxID=68225 RepID=A0ABU6CR77_9ACTN|nr:histidine kinase [Streptomyces kunmingensis]MEB3966436.1 histidine kinase [Streptomyces kunmingensis]
MSHEAAVTWAAVRAADRRTVTAETILCALAAVFCLVPLLLVNPHRPVLAVVQGLWAALLVPARRGRPAVAVLGASLLVEGANVWTMAVAPLVVLSATRRLSPPRRAWQLVGAACAVVGVLTLVLAAPRIETLAVRLAGNAVSAVLLLVLPALAGTLLARRRPLVRLLRERNAYLEQARALTAAAARMEERTRVAGEMHDLLGHRLSLISVHAGALELAASRQAPGLVGQAELLRTTAGTAMEELREILGVLRRESLTDLTDPTDREREERGTREDISALVTESRQTGSTVELYWSLPDETEVGAPARQALHRIVREGLTNVLKHASGAPTRVDITGADGGIAVSVTNAAPRATGPSQGGTRSGLAGCQERTSLLGGTFWAGALADGGFRVAAWLPARGNAAADPSPDPCAHPSAETPRFPAGGPDLIGQRGAHAPLPDEVLTWPRVLGSGCVALFVVLVTVVSLVALLIFEVLT